jgi:hypothetical protein
MRLLLDEHISPALDTGYVAGVVGGQKRGSLRDLIGGAGTAQRYVGDRALHELFDLLERHSQRGVVGRRRG